MKIYLSRVQFSWTYRLKADDRETDVNVLPGLLSTGIPVGKDRIYETRDAGLEAARSLVGFTEILIETYRNEYRRYWLKDELVAAHLEELHTAARRHINGFPVILEVSPNKAR